MKWKTHQMRLIGTNELLGGMPKKEDLIEGQMSSKAIRIKAKGLGRDPEAIIAENMVAMGIEPGESGVDEKSMACGFRRAPSGTLCLGAHQIGSMLTDCATTLRLSRRVMGLKDLLTRGLEVQTEWPNLIPILNGENVPVTEPSGTLEWGLLIRDRMGSRAILRRYDYVMPWSLKFTVRFADTGIMTGDIWADLWEMAMVQGLGAARPRGYGRFRNQGD